MLHHLNNVFTNRTNQEASQLITIFPKSVVFQDIYPHNCYEIVVHVRNQTKEMETIKVINPKTKLFTVKIEEGPCKKLAPGLTMKIYVYFNLQSKQEKQFFCDELQVLGNKFKETVTLKAFTPKSFFIIPKIWNLGRLRINTEHQCSIPIKNNGKIAGKLSFQLKQHNVIDLQTTLTHLQPSQSQKITLKAMNKRPGPYQTELIFSNGSICLIKCSFVQQCIDMVDKQGNKLKMIDLGNVFIGQEIVSNFFVLNNSSEMVDCFFKVLSKGLDGQVLKLDKKLNNIIIQLTPENYIKELKNCYSSIKTEKHQLPPYLQLQNQITLLKEVSETDLKYFQENCFNNKKFYDEEVYTQENRDVLVVKLSNQIHCIKIPIKYQLQIPNIKVSASLLQFGELKEREDSQRQLEIYNHTHQDIHLQFQTSKQIHINGPKVLPANSSETFKVVLRVFKFGNVNETIKIKFWQKLYAEVKVFAICRSSSIRMKKITNLHTTRQPHKLYSTISQINLTISHNQSAINFYSTLHSNNENKGMKNVNKLDLLGQLRAQKLMKIKKEKMQRQQQLLVDEPTLRLNLDKSLNMNKKWVSHIKRQKNDEEIKINIKQQKKYAGALTLQQLQNIIILQNRIDFGNIFIDTQIIKDLKVTNKNNKPILFQWKTNGYQCFQETSTSTIKIQPFSQQNIKFTFKPNMLGSINLPLEYVINKAHPFQIGIIAFVYLVNLEVSAKEIDFHFGDNDMSFEKIEEIQLRNNGNTHIKASLNFAENKHFGIENENITVKAKSSIKIKLIYRPLQQSESGLLRQDFDRLTIKVLNGGDNSIKCKGSINDAKISIKQTQISFLNYLSSTPIYGKLNLRNHLKSQTIYKIEIGPQLSGIISIDKLCGILSCEQKKEINYTILCHQARKIISYLYFYVRGGRSYRVHVELSFVIPEIEVSKQLIDFGNIPIMGSNYQETLTLTNLYKNEIRLEYFKKVDNDDYSIQIRQILQKIRTEHSIRDVEEKFKKNTYRKEELKEKKVTTNKVFRLFHNAQICLQLKFIPKKLQNFNIPIPLKLCGTLNNNVQPVNVRLLCCGIQPVVYLRPQKLLFEPRIIGQGKSSHGKIFEIRNPHEYDILWHIELKQYQKSRFFDFSEESGRLLANQSVRIEVIFSPQQEGQFSQRFNVVLSEKKISHISLQLEGSAIFPSIKFNCNEILMPIVPLAFESKKTIVLQNHGYDAITISKWKTSNTFQNLDINLHFKEGKLLSLAKQKLKVQITILSSYPISFTTFLQFYDEFGNKYDVQLSCTIENSLMTVYPFVQCNQQAVVQRRQNYVQIQKKGLSVYEQNNPVNSIYKQKGCEFIKNWLNYQINLNIRQFPADLIQSQGQLFMKMVNKMSSNEFIKKYHFNHQNTLNLYNYYNDNIKILKAEGAFLNQIRPEYLLPFAQYQQYIHSKNGILYQQPEFHKLSVTCWTALFYQLVKLYLIPQITDKMLHKFSIPTTNISSNLYSTTELQIFRFLNFFAKEKEEAIYTFNDQIKFLQILQKSLEKILKINLTNALLSLKINSGAMTPNSFLQIIGKFIYQRLKEYGFSLYLGQSDLLLLGMKQLMLYLVSFINLLNNYHTSSVLCYQASIGDRITKVIQIQNPLNKKITYKTKLIGSTEFKFQASNIVLNSKSRAEIKVLYHCKQNKEEEATLLLIPYKEDIHSAIGQPLAFKLITSIFSKITIKQLQVEAKLYEITNLSLEVQLPVQMTQSSQFNVSLLQIDGSNQTFYCFNQLKRTLKVNHDKLQIKIIPLTMENKHCQICYRSVKYGQFYIEIDCKILLPEISKEIKLKQLQINKPQTQTLTIPKNNHQILQIMKFCKDFNIKSNHQLLKKAKNSNIKYHLSLEDTTYLSIVDDYTIWTNEEDRKEYINFNVKCDFDQPFHQYGCNLIVKAQNGKESRDIRYFKLNVSVATSPKIISLTIKAKARESAAFKVPVTIAPCSCLIESTIQQLTLNNFSPFFKVNSDLMFTFSPQWILQRKVNIIFENSETLEQIIYEIQLIGQQPSFFDTIRLQGSEIFPKKVRIPIKLQTRQKYGLLLDSKRLVLQTEQYLPTNQKFINAIINPSQEQQSTSLKLTKPQSPHFYHCQLSIHNKPLEVIRLHLEQKPLNKLQLLVKEIILNKNDYKIIFLQESYLKWCIKQHEGVKHLQLIFEPSKEMQEVKHLYVMVGNLQYDVQIHCKSPQLPPILLPDIYSLNLKSKNSSFNLINPSSTSKGTYKISSLPQGILHFDTQQYEFRQKQKRQIHFTFNPAYLNTKYKILIRCESSTLPKYQYIINGSSDYKYEEKEIFYEYMIDRQNYKEIFFRNYFQKKEEFFLEKDQDKFAPFQIVEPEGNKFTLQAGEVKKIIIKNKDYHKEIQGKDAQLVIRLGQKKWKHNITPILIKYLCNKKYNWNCKARETIIENIQLPNIHIFKDIQSSPEISPFITYNIQEGTNILKIKFNPMKPIPNHQYHIYLLCQQQKYAVNMFIHVTEADYDDKILIKTKEINQLGCVSFKLTNTKKNTTPFKAYFMKAYPDLKVQLEKNTLDGYGKPGTTIYVKFTSNVYNKKVQDQLYIQTSEMLWRFKVKGIVSKIIPKS